MSEHSPQELSETQEIDAAGRLQERKGNARKPAKNGQEILKELMELPAFRVEDLVHRENESHADYIERLHSYKEHSQGFEEAFERLKDDPEFLQELEAEIGKLYSEPNK